jgi:hypothetical protein
LARVHSLGLMTERSPVPSTAPTSLITVAPGGSPLSRLIEYVMLLAPCDTKGMNQPLDRMMRPLAGLFGVR